MTISDFLFKVANLFVYYDKVQFGKSLSSGGPDCFSDWFKWGQQDYTVESHFRADSLSGRND
jgi:hypothetical protein